MIVLFLMASHTDVHARFFGWGGGGNEAINCVMQSEGFVAPCCLMLFHDKARQFFKIESQREIL